MQSKEIGQLKDLKDAAAAMREQAAAMREHSKAIKSFPASCQKAAHEIITEAALFLFAGLFLTWLLFGRRAA